VRHYAVQLDVGAAKHASELCRPTADARDNQKRVERRLPTTCGLSANINSIHKAATRRGRSRKSQQNPIGTPSGFRSHATVCSRTDAPYLILL
jgi:hypothetical protein